MSAWVRGCAGGTRVTHAGAACHSDRVCVRAQHPSQRGAGKRPRTPRLCELELLGCSVEVCKSERQHSEAPGRNLSYILPHRFGQATTLVLGHFGG